MRNAADVSFPQCHQDHIHSPLDDSGSRLLRSINSLIFSIGYRLRRGYEAPNLVRNTFSIVAYVIILFILLKWHYPTVDLGALFTTSAIFGVIIGLALQDTLGNLFAGISLQADKPFQVGDVITVGQWTGVVEEITWRGIKLRTFQNHIVLISNSQAGKESIEVCPRDNLNARLVFFNTLYTDSPARAIHVVREAVREADNVSREITPSSAQESGRQRRGLRGQILGRRLCQVQRHGRARAPAHLVRLQTRRSELRVPDAHPLYRATRKERWRGSGWARFRRATLSRRHLRAPLDGRDRHAGRRFCEPRFRARRNSLSALATRGRESSSHGRVKVQISDNGKPRTVRRAQRWRLLSADGVHGRASDRERHRRRGNGGAGRSDIKP